LYREYCIDKRLTQRVRINGSEPECRNSIGERKKGKQNGSSENKNHGDLSRVVFLDSQTATTHCLYMDTATRSFAPDQSRKHLNQYLLIWAWHHQILDPADGKLADVSLGRESLGSRGTASCDSDLEIGVFGISG